MRSISLEESLSFMFDTTTQHLPSHHEILITESEEVLVDWKVQHGATVRRGEIIATYCICESKLHDTKLNGGQKSEEKINRVQDDSSYPKPNQAGGIIRAKKRGCRSGMNKTASLTDQDTIATPHNTDFVGTYLENEATRDNRSLTSNKSSFLRSVIERVVYNDDLDGVRTESKPLNEALSSGTMDDSIPGRKILNTINSKWLPIRAQTDGFIHIYPSVEWRNDHMMSNKSQTLQVLGLIKPCAHPMWVDGLCAVCGESSMSSSSSTSPSLSNVNTVSQRFSRQSDDQWKNSAFQPYKPKNPTHDSLTVSGGITIEVSSDYAASIATQLSNALHKARKLHLVLDLDHTLVHATSDPRAASWKTEHARTDVHAILLPAFDPTDPYPQVFHMEKNNHLVVRHFVKFRNCLAEFLDAIIDKYEITIYTAGTRVYANKTVEAMCRHLLNHQKNKINGSTSLSGSNTTSLSDNSSYCLDEDDLLALRAKVAHMEQEVERLQCRKNRRLILDKVNESWNRNQGNDTVKCNGNISQNQPEGNETSNEKIGTMIQHKDDDVRIKSKRKRVLFEDTSNMIPEDVSDLSNCIGPISVPTMESTSNNQSHGSDVDLKQSLENLRSVLAQAEAREEEANALRMKLIGSRIVSRTDVGDLGKDVKSLRRVFPCGGKMAAIVDDREDVWANADDVSSEKLPGEPPDNLLLAKPFHWRPFLGYADVNNASGADITRKYEDSSNVLRSADDSNDLQLLWTSDILSRLHARYYSVDDLEDLSHRQTVPSILRQMRKEVLGSEGRQTKIVLSGLIPLNLQQQGAGKDARFPLIRYAETLGAEVLPDVTNEVTHIVAASDGTDKIKRARQIAGCSIVNVAWLMECYWSISLRDTKPYLIGPPPVQIAGSQDSANFLLSSDEEEDFKLLEAQFD